MKIMVASDIHGSAYYCEWLIENYKISEAQRLLLLGDILYHGPRNDLPKDYDPKKVAELLNEYKDNIMCIRGNCDSEVDDMVLSFPVTAEYAVLFDGERMIFATHGHRYNIDNIPPMKSGDILLYGHTHVPLCTAKKGVNIMNPGSVSIPKENSPHSYMIIEDGVYSWHDFEGNVYMSVE